LLATGLLLVSTAGMASCPATLDHHLRPLAGDEQVHLCEALRDQVVLVVNTASRCGYTYQYEGLEKLYAQYRDRGLVVAGFPSNDFAGQEPGSEEQIKDFCRLTYGVKFPMFEKVHVRGRDVSPFYQQLARESGETPRWNFHKYLLDRKGQVVASFPSQVEPDDPRLVKAIEEQL
jgi:glutathione peroxidase